MATGARLVDAEQLKRQILELSPSRNKVTENALSEMALLVLRIASQSKIKRGGKGSPVKGKLTSRTGTLRRSLTPIEGVDKSGLSLGFIEVGSKLVYANVHETGGTFQKGGHVRMSKKGKRVGVKPHSVTYPPRPFLKPALADAVSQFERIFVKHWKRAAQL